MGVNLATKVTFDGRYAPNPYSLEVRTYTVRMFSTLNEKGRRHYSAIEELRMVRI